MYSTIHSIHSLFYQLGLASSDRAINAFVAKNGTLPSGIKLHQADFWNAALKTFLQQMIDEDADWAEIVDELDAKLR